MNGLFLSSSACGAAACARPGSAPAPGAVARPHRSPARATPGSSGCFRGYRGNSSNSSFGGVVPNVQVAIAWSRCPNVRKSASKTLRNGMLRLHKSLLDSERAAYERDVARITSAGE